MSRYKVGQTVYSGRGDKMKTLVVARVIENHLIPVNQYTFEPPHDGYATGEQSIRATPDGRDRTIRESFRDDYESQVPTRINTMASVLNQSINSDEQYIVDTDSDLLGTDVQFRPDLKFAKWLTDYADGRLIIDVGSGQGHLIRMIKMAKGKVMGIEPNFDTKAWLKWTMLRNGCDGGVPNINEVLPRTFDQSKNIINGMGVENVLIVFARPNGDDFVEDAIRSLKKGTEVLFITTPENLKRYNALGEYVLNAEPIDHEGQSEDNEVVLRLKR